MISKFLSQVNREMMEVIESLYNAKLQRKIRSQKKKLMASMRRQKESM